MIYERRHPGNPITTDYGHIQFVPGDRRDNGANYGQCDTADATLQAKHRVKFKDRDGKDDFRDSTEQELNRMIEDTAAFQKGKNWPGKVGIWKKDDRIGPERVAQRRADITDGFACLDNDTLRQLIIAKDGEVPAGDDADKGYHDELVALAVKCHLSGKMASGGRPDGKQARPPRKQQQSGASLAAAAGISE